MRGEKGEGEDGESLKEWDGWNGRGSHFKVGKRLDSRGVPRCPRRCPQLVPWAAEERVPELALSYSHTDEYLPYHHRNFICRWVEIETETHIGALD